MGAWSVCCGMMVQSKDAGDPTFPAASMARTSKVWEPTRSGPYPIGLAHAEYAPGLGLSRRHWKCTPPEDGAESCPENWKLAIPLGVSSDGLLVIVTVGGTVSTLQPHEAT